VNGDGDVIDGGRRTSVDFYAPQALGAIAEGLEPAAVQWVKSLRDNLQPFPHGVYVNRLGETSEELVRTAYGPNYARLVEIKKTYDPKNVLRLSQNIQPVAT
jgi:Berberine and berberine like